MFPPGAAGFPIVDVRTGETEEMATGRGYRAIASLRASSFDAAEQRRIGSLEAIGQLQPP